MEYNVNKMNDFITFFEDEVFPVMQAENKNGINHFKEVVKKRRAEVEAKKAKREKKIFQNKVEAALKSYHVSTKYKESTSVTKPIFSNSISVEYDWEFNSDSRSDFSNKTKEVDSNKSSTYGFVQMNSTTISLKENIAQTA